jgi:hypothetical protein
MLLWGLTSQQIRGDLSEIGGGIVKLLMWLLESLERRSGSCPMFTSAFLLALISAASFR